MPRCVQCGSELGEGDQYCQSCGAAVTAEGLGVAAVPPAEAGAPVIAAAVATGGEVAAGEPDAAAASGAEPEEDATPAAEPAAEPTAEPAAEPTAEPAAEPTAADDLDAIAPPQAPAPTEFTPPFEAPPSKDRRPLIAAIIVLGLLLVAGVIWGIASLPMFEDIKLVYSAESDVDASMVATGGATESSATTVAAPIAVATSTPAAAATGTPSTPKSNSAATAEDGKHMAQITKINSADTPKTIALDYVQMLTGDAAQAAADAHNDEVTNDYYVVNDNKKIRTFPVSRKLVIVLHPGEGAQYKRTFSLSHFSELLQSGGEETIADKTYRAEGMLYDVTIKDGEIVRVEHYWTP